MTQRTDEFGEGIGVSKVLMLSEELKLTGLMGADELFAEQSSEQSGQDFHGQEEAGIAGDPLLAVGGDATAGDDTVDMRMMGEG